MAIAEKILFSWSSGKDSGMALHLLKDNKNIEVIALLTTITENYDRVSMHGVRKELLETQAVSLGCALETVSISTTCTNAEWEEKIQARMLKFKKMGITSVAFGDIFLEDLKKYRETNLAKVGLKGIFPLWKIDTVVLAKQFIEKRFKAIITCVDAKKLDKSFCGREYDESFLADLPKNVDCCGENGEFHSFVYDGPVFQHAVAFKKGDVVLRNEQFYFCDLIPVL